MINYIGDLSRNDAFVLQQLAIHSNNILEYGCGGSTQILANYTNGKVTSVESEKSWIDRTKENLKLLGIEKEVDFHNYYFFEPTGEYDFIFVDLVDGFRLEAALKSWNNLAIGGIMAFHDTRRDRDVKNVCELLSQKSAEVQEVHFNTNHSNITTIKKKIWEGYECWPENEGYPKWKYGYEEVNMEEFTAMKDNL